MCFQCRGGQTRLDCRGRVCPFYFVLKQAKLEPVLWWKHPTGMWEKTSQAAYRFMVEEAAQRKKKVRIKVKKKRRRKKRKVKLVI